MGRKGNVASLAPGLDGDEWVTSGPVQLDELRGRVVMLVFFSAGCEASLLRLREVTAVADAARGPVTVLGVHSPRLPFEANAGLLRSVLAQYQVAVPVLHDPELRTWERYNPEGRPATFVIDARGKVLGAHHGIGDAGLLAETVALALGSLPRDRSGIPAAPTADALPLPEGDLAFPTAVALMTGGELVVADFGHRRLLIFELSADRRQATAAAEIDGLGHPQSVAVDGNDALYVVEPLEGTVSFLDLRGRTRQLLAADLVCPTGVTLDADGSAVVADSGADKLYRIINGGGPHNIRMGCIAGSGLTGTADGPAGQAELAQPTGLARTEAGLVFCDAASSNLRLLTDNGKVATITGSDLTRPGLQDGPAHKARLQRPSSLTVLADGTLVVADSGNSRLRRLAGRRLRTLGLSGLNRPMGVCALPDGHLAVADTGNNRIVIVDPDLQTAWPLALRGVLPPRDLSAVEGESGVSGEACFY